MQEDAHRRARMEAHRACATQARGVFISPVSPFLSASAVPRACDASAGPASRALRRCSPSWAPRSTPRSAFHEVYSHDWNLGGYLLEGCGGAVGSRLGFRGLPEGGPKVVRVRHETLGLYFLFYLFLETVGEVRVSQR